MLMLVRRASWLKRSWESMSGRYPSGLRTRRLATQRQPKHVGYAITGGNAASVVSVSYEQAGWARATDAGHGWIAHRRR